MTRSGIKIIFNDDEKSLHIEDPSGNTWNMDRKGNIAVNAPENMTLNSKNMFVNVDENIEVNVGADATTSIGDNKKEDVLGDTGISTTNFKEEIISNSDINIGEKLTLITSETDLFTETGDIVIKSAGKALVQGAEDARISKG